MHHRIFFLQILCSDLVWKLVQAMITDILLLLKEGGFLCRTRLVYNIDNVQILSFGYLSNGVFGIDTIVDLDE